MSGYLATSPNGPLPTAIWRCQNCPARCDEVYRSPGSAGDDVRDEAIGHLRTTGHAVTFWRGTAEAFQPLATAADSEVP